MTASASGAISMSATAAALKPGVQGVEPVGQLGARDHDAAGQAAHPVVAAVQVDDVPRARRLVQQVDVLRDQPGDHAAVLQRGQRAVARVRHRPVHVPPPDVVARPVVATEPLVRRELLERHRGARRGVRAAVVGDAGVRRDPRPRERREAVAGEDLDRRPPASRRSSGAPPSVHGTTVGRAIRGTGLRPGTLLAEVACPSGLRSTPRKRVWVKVHRGFKSHRYRQSKGPTRVNMRLWGPSSFVLSGAGAEYVARMADLVIRALTAETFEDFAALNERNGGMFAGCGARSSIPTAPRRTRATRGNRAFKRRLVAEGLAHAALVYDGDRAVAWAQYGSPEELPASTTARSTSPRPNGCPTTG